MPKQETKTIYCATCNSILLKTDDTGLGRLVIKCKECGTINKILLKVIYEFEVSILKNVSKSN